jgi:7-cyano-7-deazaguanine synthase in queuosine biosynthesis
VAHRPANPAIAAAQEHVRQCLARRFGHEVESAAIRCGPAPGSDTEHPYPPPEARETSQRTRAFLFLSLGAAACHATGSEVLYCPENGVLAVNLPLTEARVGGYSTAGTRPRTLSRFAELLRALGLPLRIENPFVYQTKGQLVRDVLRPSFAAADIQGAVSCWMAGRASRPCGTCIPCLVRALAMQTAGLPREAHLVDPLSTGGETGPESAARANLVDLITLTHRLRALSDQELLHAYPVLLELPPDAAIRPAVAMLRRFAEEAEQALAEERW